MLAEIFVKLSLLSVFAVIVWVVIAGLLNRRLASDMEREYKIAH